MRATGDLILKDGNPLGFISKNLDNGCLELIVQHISGSTTVFAEYDESQNVLKRFYNKDHFGSVLYDQPVQWFSFNSGHFE